MLRLSRVNIYTGQPEARVLNCTQADVDNYMFYNMPIEMALPNLSEDEREFVNGYSVAEFQRQMQL